MIKKYLNTVAIIFAAAVIVSCNGSGEKTDDTAAITNELPGGVVPGGTFRASETEPIQVFYPPSTVDAITVNFAIQVQEGLVKLSTRDMSVQPLLAERWEESADRKTYTFFLKKGVLFHDDLCFKGGKGREVKSSDVKFAVEQLCTYSSDNLMFVITLKDVLSGANKYFEASKSGKPAFDLEGIKIMDDYTVQFHLESPNSSFLNILSTYTLSIYPREAYEKYGNKLTVGTGPFKVSPGQSFPAENKLVLLKNENYHGVDSLGNKLPFLDSIEVTIMNSKKAQLEEFKKGNLNIVFGLPSESIKELVEENITDFQSKPPSFVLTRAPELSTKYLAFTLNKKPFNDKKVRQAINYAIDRKIIIEDLLHGESFGPGEHGLTPPSIKEYVVDKIRGYSLDVAKAKQLLAEAGYPDGKGFPDVKLELSSGGQKNTNVAIELQKQLMINLNISVELEVVSLAQKIEDQRYGKADFFRSTWVADYPSPANFLQLYYGKTVPKSLGEPSFPNTSRYVNPKFDELFEKAQKAVAKEDSYNYFLQAEQILMDDAPLVVLYYGENFVLVQSNVRNFFSSPLMYVDFSQIYFKKPTGALKGAG